MTVAHVYEFSFCVAQPSPFILAEVIDISQFTLGGVTCLLVVFQFIRESLQMYKATKRFQLNRYMNLLVREGVIYYLAYAHALVFHFLVHQTNDELF